MERLPQFTTHAFQRLKQRTQLNCWQLVKIFEKKRYVNLGHKPGIAKDHLLFYSPVDGDYFVAIMDNITGTVITLLTLGYQENLAWKPTQVQCYEAKRRALCVEKSKPEVQPRAQSFLVNAHYLDESQRPKIKKLWTASAVEYGYDVVKLAASQSFIPKALKTAKSIGVEVSAMTAVSVRLGRRGTPFFIDLMDPTLAVIDK